MFKKEKSSIQEKKSRKIYFFFFVIIFVFVIDHILKILALKNECIFGLCFSYETNRGAAFSLFSNFNWTLIVLIIISLIVLVLAIYFYFKDTPKGLPKLALPLIASGTLSNLLDRLVFGYVIDYIPFFSSRLFTFNLADVSNVIGVVLLSLFLIRKR